MQAKVTRMYEVPTGASVLIHKIGFDPTTPGVDRGYLVVQFTNLDVWGYADVSYFDVLLVMNSPSIGKAFHTTIKGKYKGVALTKKDTHVVNPGDVSQPKPKEVDDLPMLDVIGVDSSTVGKVTSRRKK